MLAKLSLILDNNEITYKQSSNLQGVIMENITCDYAEEMHRQGVNPYSQCVDKVNGQTIWNIKTLNTEAYEKIILPLLSESFNGFEIKKRDTKANIIGKNLTSISKNQLMNDFYEGTGCKYINVEFITPTAFKSNGKYVYYPDLRLIYNNLMNRYSSVSQEVDMRDEDTLEQLVINSEIAHYKLRSCLFPLEGITVPGFVGNITIKISGNKMLSNYAKLLFLFGEYAGVGIKTSMGMGSIRLYDRGNEKR